MVINFVMVAFVAVKRINRFMNSEELDPNNVTNHSSDKALEISDGVFSWGEEIPTLRNINLPVKKGNLSAVVGPVGCGKTSLISALLGEMEKIRGSANVDGTIAYVPQQVNILKQFSRAEHDKYLFLGMDPKCNPPRQHHIRQALQQEIVQSSRRSLRLNTRPGDVASWRPD